MIGAGTGSVRWRPQDEQKRAPSGTGASTLDTPSEALIVAGRGQLAPVSESDAVGSTGLARSGPPTRLDTIGMTYATPVATPPPSTMVAAAGAVDATKIYGVGDAEVRALDGVTVSFEPGTLHRDHGPVGLRQVDAAALPRRARRADRGAVFIGET